METLPLAVEISWKQMEINIFQVIDFLLFSVLILETIWKLMETFPVSTPLFWGDSGNWLPKVISGFKTALLQFVFSLWCQHPVAVKKALFG